MNRCFLLLRPFQLHNIRYLCRLALSFLLEFVPASHDIPLILLILSLAEVFEVFDDPLPFKDFLFKTLLFLGTYPRFKLWEI